MAIIPFFAAVFFAFQPDLFRHQASVGLFFCSFVTALKVYDLNRIYGLAFFIFAAMAVCTFSASPPPPEWAVSTAAQSFAWLVVITVTASIISPKALDAVFEVLGWACLGTSIYLIVVWAFQLQPTNVAPYAWMNNRAADASMVAALWPALALRPRVTWRFEPSALWWDRAKAVVPIVAVTVCGSSTGYLAMILAILTLAWYQRKSPVGTVVAFVLLCLTLPGVLVLKHALLADSGRHEMWILMGKFWANTGNYFTGIGSGSFFVLGPAVQQANGWPNGSLFSVAHNEFLQILFEQGAIGLVIFLIFCAAVLRRAYCKPWLFASLLTYGFTMLSQFPLRWFLSALIGTFLVRGTCEEE